VNDVENTEKQEQSNESKLQAYNTVCVKLGLSMCVYFICRYLSARAVDMFGKMSDGMSQTLYHLIYTLIVIMLVYIIPILFTAVMFNSFSVYKGKFKILYKRPRRLARAFGTFPAMFGLGHGIVLLTLLVSYLLSKVLGGQTLIEDLLRPTTFEPTTNIVAILMMVFLLIVIAPVLEEFWTRGIMYDALKPFGTGMAILISSILFGLMHGSLYMLFYTTAYGLTLGYIRYATGSLFTVTILHAIVNSIGAVALLLSTLVQITNEENRIINTVNMIYIIAVLVLIIIGIVVFITKIPAIRKYKIENSWTEVKPGKKAALFFLSIPVIIMLVLAFNEITRYWLADLLLG